MIFKLHDDLQLCKAYRYIKSVRNDGDDDIITYLCIKMFIEGPDSKRKRAKSCWNTVTVYDFLVLSGNS